MYFEYQLSSNGGDGLVDINIPETTKVLDEDTIGKITYISDDRSVLEFAQPTPQLNKLNVGDIIVMGVTEYTPEGLLRKVTKITKSGKTIIVETEFGTLEEAIEDGEFHFEISLKPEDIEESLSRTEGVERITDESLLRDSTYDFNYKIDVLAYDGDENPDTLEDNVNLSGNIAFDYDIVFNWKIEDHELKNLTFNNVFVLENTVKMDVGGASITLNLDPFSLFKKPIPIGKYLVPGPIPIVLTAYLDIKWSIQAGFYASLTTEVTRTDTITAGLEWNNGAPQPIAEHHADYDASLTTSKGFMAKVSVGPELFVKIYGVAGPYCKAGPYIKGTGDKYADPWWELRGGIEALVGVKLDIFRLIYAEAQLTVLDVSKTILQADGPFPNYAPIITTLVADSDTLPVNESTTITCYASDPDGDSLTYDWSSQDGGTISGSGSTITWTAPSTQGSYPVNCTVSDWRESVSEQVIITVGEGVVGQISGSVKDAVTQSHLSDVLVKVYDGNPLISSGTTDSSGVYSISVPAGSGYRVEFTKSGYIPAIYYDVSVVADVTTYLETVLQIDDSYSGLGAISGTISNALTGGGVSGLMIKFREGINVTSGTVITSTATGSGGYYTQNLYTGYYTAEVSGTGYNTGYFTVICIGGITTANQDATITPILSPGETRIILTWGETPSDLDSHLTGPTPDDSRFHIYYWQKTYAYSGITYADLDLDDVTSYGPETTTIYQQIPGVYRFSVHDYTNRGSSYSTALSNSGAQVRLYSGDNLVATFNVPANQEGTLWTVFEIDGDTIMPINTMSYESSPSVVRQSSTPDAELMKNLPPKR